MTKRGGVNPARVIPSPNITARPEDGVFILMIISVIAGGFLLVSMVMGNVG